MARLCIFSDSHGNLAGIEATLAHAREHGCDVFLCLGDIADGTEDGEQAALFMRRSGIPCVRGNHDEDRGTTPLTDDTRAWLTGLPRELRRGDVLFTHIGPGDDPMPILSPWRAASVFEDHAHFRLLFIGHLHYPMLYAERSELTTDPAKSGWHYGVELPLDPTDRYIACVGSVGYPRDGMRQLRYAIYDDGRHALTFMRFKGPLLDFGV